ncbi:MAG: hypothetical protein IKU94_04365 [Bacteroidaceae bacterium]|nr:hypothetical protein [Bacteroidaceae bacterium]MBR5607685.1 hypothetical protein [Bacteroidaceae bacterium]
MKKILTAALALMLFTVTVKGQTTSLKKVYDETIDPIEQLDKALAKAKAEKAYRKAVAKADKQIEKKLAAKK